MIFGSIRKLSKAIGSRSLIAKSIAIGSIRLLSIIFAFSASAAIETAPNWAESEPPIRFKSRDWADAVLGAASTNASIAIEGGRLLTNTTWDATKTHLVFNTVYVPSGITLTISEGAVVKFCPGTTIKVEDGGRLSIIGARGSDVILTAANDATVGEVVAGLDDEPIAFDGIRLQSTASTFTDNGYLETRGFNYGAFPTVSVLGTEAVRNGGVAYVPFTLSGSSRETTFSVEWEAVQGTAKFGDDYTLASGTISWGKSSEGTKTLQIPLNAANVTGEERTFTVRIKAARCSNIGTRTATVKIVERDELTLEWAGDWAESEPPIRFKSRDWADSVLAAASTNDAIAIEGGRLLSNATWDATKTHLVFNTVYVPSGVTLTISEGAIVKFCPGTMIKVEDGGKLNIVGASGNDVILTAANDATAGEAIAGLGEESITFDGIRLQSNAATFTDNGWLETRGFNYGAYPSVTLNDSTAFRSSGLASIPVTISGTRDQTLTIDWVAEDGTAKYGEDYTLASGRITWSKASEGTKTIAIPLVASHIVGETTTFKIKIVTARGSNIADGECTVSIREFDTLNIESASAESTPPIRFKSRDWADAVLAAASTNSSIAVEGGRLLSNAMWSSERTHLVFNTVYVPSGITLTISEGAVVKFCPGTMIKVEDGGKLNIVGASGNDVILTAANDATAGEAIAGLGDESIAFDGIRLQSTAATFTDNGWLETRGFNYSSYPNVTLHDATANRKAGMVYLPVTVGGTARNQSFTVDWVAEDESAQFGRDYATHNSGRLTWSKSGDGTKYITIPLITTETAGSNRTFKVRFVVARGVNVTDGEATVTIAEFAFDGLNGQPVEITTNAVSSTEFAIKEGIGSQPIFLNDVEQVRYSGKWQTYDENEAAALRVTVDSDNGTKVLKECSVEETGSFELKLADYATGFYTLKHEILNNLGETLATMKKSFSIIDTEDVELHGGILTQSETWSADKVHVVYETVTVPAAYTLFIEPGAIVKFMTGTGIDISQGGALFANKIVFTHINDDTIGGDTLSDGYTVAPPMDAYTLSGNFTFGDDTELRNITQNTALAGTISTRKVLSRGSTYRVSGTLTVANGGSLTIPPGTVLKMESGASIVVNSGATLTAVGTRAAPIIITSIKDDSVSGDTNGDGDKTIPQPGDWVKIGINGGTANFEFTSILYSSKNQTTGAINMNGGTVVFNNSEIAHGMYDAVGVESGHFYMTNSVIRDCLLAFRHWAKDPVVNSVIYDCGRLTQGGGQHFVNCIFSRITETWEAFGFPQNGTTYDNCCFWNEGGSVLTAEGNQDAMTVCGKNGNIWGDPLFVDPDNGDFRIQEGSPCVDAADSSVAPEYDYYGQPRITVTEQGTNTIGQLADIGICEVMPRNVTSDIDLVPQLVRADTNAVPGQLLFVKWEVGNAGGVALEGAWRDTVSLVSSNGREVVLGNKTTTGVIAPGGSIFCSGYFTVPPISEGEWYPKVNVNSYRDVFEGALGVNNALVGERALTVKAEALDPSVAREGVIGGGTPSVIKLTFGADDENRMVKFDVPAGVKVTWGFGFMPQGASQSGSMTATDGGVMFRVPEGATDVYVVLESDKTATYEMTTESTKMVITGVTPNTLPASGTTTLTITGAGFGETNDVVLATATDNYRVQSIAKDASGNLIATVDCSTLTAGVTYDLIVSNGNVLVRAAAAITTLSESGSWNIAYDVEIPGFVREQRVFSGWIVFENTGNIDAPLPIFILSSDDNNTSFMTSSHSAVWRTKLSLLGVSYTGQTSVKPGEKCRIPFYAKVTSDRAGSISIAVLEETRTVDYNDVCAMMNFDASDYALMQKVRGLYGLNWSDFADSIRQFVIKYPNIVEIDYDINALVNRFLTEYDGKCVYGRLNTTTSVPKDIKMMLYNVSDNCETPTVTAVTYCDTEGVFCFQNITNGNYCIRAESVNNEPCLIEMSDSSEDVSAVLNQQPFGMINIALPLGAETYSTNLVLAFENRLTHEQVKYKVPCGVNSVTVDSLYSGEYSVTLFGDGQLFSSVDLVRVSDANISLDFAPVDFLTLSGTVLSNEGELIDAVIKVGNKTYRTDSLTGNFSFNVISNDCILLCCSAEGYESHIERIEDFSENKIVYMTRAHKVHGQVLFDGLAVPIGTIIEFSNGERSIPCLTLKDGLYAVELGPGAWNARYVNSEGNEFNQSFFVETPIELNLKFESIINSQSKGLRSLSNIVDTVKLYAIEEYCFLIASGFASTYGLIGGYFESAQLLNLYLGVRGHNLGKRVSPVNYGVDSEISKLAKSKNDGFECSYSSVFNEVQAVIKGTLKSGCLGGCGRVNKKADYNGNIFSPLFVTFGGTKGTAYEYSAKKIGEDDVSITYYVNVVTTLFDTYEFYGHKDSISVKMIILADVGWATVFETSLSIKDEFVCIVEKDNDPCPGEGEKYGYFTITQSHDPNEMVGPLGLGDPDTERFVKPGEWMTYTVYFENMTNATAAAQEVYVTNPLSEWLDWSTFEMGEVSFGNQIDLGLSGKSGGTSEATMKGTNFVVRTQLEIEPLSNAIDGSRQQSSAIAKWYLRIVDPSTDTGWPIDPVAGFLPPNNPDIHCGEGHITYRVKLRDDVPLGTKIENSATIVFDFNEPIKTDPSWWNIVGGDIGDKSLDVTFAMGETELNQDGNYIYDGTAKTPGVSLKVKVGSEIKTLAEGRDFKCTYYDNVNANSEENHPRISIEAIGNYVGSIVTNFVIAPREVTLTSGSASKVYDGTALVNSTVTVGGDGFVDGEGATFNVAGSQTNVGESENVFSYMLNDGTKASNYTITTANGTLTVTKTNVGGGTGGGAVGNEEPGDGEVPQGGISKFDASCVYDGEGHTIDTNALVAAFGSAIVGASVVEYAIDDGSVSGGVGHASLPWLETAPVYTNAGEYIVWYRVTNQNYEDFTHAAKLTITPRTGVVVDIVGNVATNVYSGAAQSIDGYTVAINDPLYKETDFEFVGNSTVSGTASGKYPMGLIASQFTNKNMNFAEVTFNVTDGELVILQPPQKNVIFDAIGGMFADGSIVTQECEDVYLAFPVATREGYVFDGWYLGVTNGAPKAAVGASLLADDDHTLFAKWQIDETLMPGGASIFAWEAIDANTVRITGFKDSAQKVSTLLLPDMIEGRFVTEIAAGAFANSKSDMTKLVLPMFCTKIGDKAFSGVTSLSEIVFADARRWDAPSENGLLTIGRYAFSGAGVEAVKLPKAVGVIGDYAFANCRKLANLTILGNPTIGVMPLRRAGLDVGGVTVHLDPALANDSAYMETLKQECGNVTVRADAIVTRMTLSLLAVSAMEIELSVSVEKAASWGKVDLSLVKVAYRESLSEKPIMLDPSSVTENADGSLTVKVVAPKGNSGFFQVVLENK